MDRQIVVELKNVTKTINHKKIVENLNFQIHSGEIFGFLGPNGAGKTTTIRMMVGLTRISEGDIFINGFSIKSDFNKAISNVGAIVENPDLYKYMTGYQNLKHFARMVQGVGKKEIIETAELLGIGNWLKNPVRTYSLGMRQRLGLAQALLHHPSLVILDEPTNGLDPEGIHELRNTLKYLAHEKGVAILVSSHLLSEMQLMCDKVGVIQHGKLITVQNIEDFMRAGKCVSSIMVDPSQIDMAYHIILQMGKNIISKDMSGKLVAEIEQKDIPAVNHKLMESGIRVYGVQTQQETLEERFLEVMEENK